MMHLLINTYQLDNEEDPFWMVGMTRVVQTTRQLTNLDVKIGKKNTRKVNNKKLLIPY